MVAQVLFSEVMEKLIQYDVTSNVFPEVWDVLVNKLIDEVDEVSIEMLFKMIYYISESGFSNKEKWS